MGIASVGASPIRASMAPTAATAAMPLTSSGVMQRSTNDPSAAYYDWNAANPREHIFDSPYDGWALNRGLMKLGGVGFWSRFSLTRAIAAMITKIPAQQLKAYSVRVSLMRIPGMKPDFARLLQMSYNNQTGGQQPLHNRAPLQWLGQFSAPGQLNDWLVRGPLVIELNTLAMNYAMSTMYTPEVPDATTLGYLAQQALSIAPPPGYNQRPFGQQVNATNATGAAPVTGTASR